MRILKVDEPATGEFITPNELNAELAAIAGGMSRLDNDNFPRPGVVTLPKVEAGAWGRTLIDPITTTRVSSLRLGDTDQTIYAIPDAAGNPWVRTFESGDGVLDIGLGACWRDTLIAVPYLIWIGVRLDGALIGQSPMGDICGVYDHAQIHCSAPVGARVHRVEAVFGANVPYLTGLRDVDWLHRVLSVREVAR